jgi:hypothetical protein
MERTAQTTAELLQLSMSICLNLWQGAFQYFGIRISWRTDRSTSLQPTARSVGTRFCVSVETITHFANNLKCALCGGVGRHG